jgi:hypothetical protein
VYLVSQRRPLILCIQNKKTFNSTLLQAHGTFFLNDNEEESGLIDASVFS